MEVAEIFSAVGVSSTTISTFLNTMFETGINFMIYVFQMIVPYLLVIGLIGLVIGLIYSVIYLFKRA